MAATLRERLQTHERQQQAREAAIGDTPQLSADSADFAETLPAFIARVSDVVAPDLITGLVPDGLITMGHGAPRGMKTWGLIEQMISICTKTPAFKLCDVAESAPGLLVTNEDPEQRIKRRIVALMKGKGIAVFPDHLHIAVHRGVWLDDEAWQERILRATEKYGYKAVFFEPLRSLSSAVDQGPRELQPLAMFFRTLIRERGCAIVVGHHDTKPPAQGRDERKRPQRASGGGIFSIADAPVHYERIGERPAVALLTPSAWKHSDTPDPIEVTLTFTDDGAAHLIGRHTTTGEAENLAVHEQVFDYVQRHPDISGSKVAQGCRIQKATVLKALEVLFERGVVDSKPGKRNATHWFAKAETVSGSGVVPNHSEGERFQ